jgi:hypothetical protein
MQSTFPTAVVGRTGEVKPRGSSMPTGGAHRATTKATTWSAVGGPSTPTHDRNAENRATAWDIAAADPAGIVPAIAFAITSREPRIGEQDVVLN